MAKNADKRASEESSEKTENKGFEVKILGGVFNLHEFWAPPSANGASVILFLTQENKIHIFKPPCNVLFII